MSRRRCLFPTLLLIIAVLSNLVLGSALVAHTTTVRTNAAQPQPQQEKAEFIGRSLWAIAQQMQKPELYSVDWADACTNIAQDGNHLVVTRHVRPGDILSLYPVHSLTLKREGRQEEDAPPPPAAAAAAANFGGNNNNNNNNNLLQLPSLRLDNFEPGLSQYKIHLSIDPSRPCTPGWLGHLAPLVLLDSSDEQANCAVVDLIGAAPFCALVASKELEVGTRLQRGSLEAFTSSKAEEFATTVTQTMAHRYAGEIEELRCYLRQAYPARHQEPAQEKQDGHVVFFNPHWNREKYPNLRALHTRPDIWAIDDFLTHRECDELIALSRPHLKPCVVIHPETGAVEEDHNSRTSTNANLPKYQVPTITSKIQSLLSIKDAERLEILQILRYQSGQQFQPHTDGFDGPTSACGFEESGRLVTIFCYLNAVPQGGETHFPQLGLEVKPQKGMAVIHFPNTMDLQQDLLTEHAGMPAVDDKWLLVTWLWKHPLSDPRYKDERMPLLGDGKILR